MSGKADSRIHANGAIAVIFAAQHSGRDAEGYGIMADAMDALAARQPGYLGMDHGGVQGGFGITVSYWADDASAKAWRDNPGSRPSMRCNLGCGHRAAWSGGLGCNL
ncbi:antibiotic biosynthesis monooxygenase family protein, partial [Sphingomonas ursincola]|uniref:antibiotic biosynthesis monooxygenase family protein n=1 Tax=Sphingomonas ursincola TaxID=56361 RepID=UPI002353B171